MKRVILSFVLLGVVLSCFSKGVNIDEAKFIASRFLQNEIKADVNVINGVVFQASEEKPLTFLINLKPEGWIIVSADDRAPAILAYSINGQFDPNKVKGLPFYFWFENYAKQIKNIISLKVPEIQHSSWKEISTGNYVKSVKAVEPLIKVTWNQGAGWNAYCPADSRGPDGHVYAGCVAVAMAQCMSVYKYPISGYGEKQYSAGEYGSQYVNFSNAQYKWDSMSTSSSDKYIALLLYHLGVSVSMDYGYDGSGAHSTSVPNAISTYFDYSSHAKYIEKASYSDEDWKNLLISELQNGRPIYYSGDDGESGHAFNIDGVNNQGAFHFNWGWSGSYNGYYTLTSLTPGSSDFTNSQAAVIGFEPRDPKPYGIELSNNTIKENLPIHSVVGTLSAVDDTPDDVHTFEISSPPDIFGNPSTVPFDVDSNKLITTEVLNYNLINSYEIIVKTIDLTGYSYEKSFIIRVEKNPSSNVNESDIRKVYAFYKDNAISFRLNDNYVGEIFVSVYSMLGTRVVTKEFYKDEGEYENTIDFNNNAKGIYLVSFKYKNDNRKVVKKVVIQ